MPSLPDLVLLVSPLLWAALLWLLALAAGAGLAAPLAGRAERDGVLRLALAPVLGLGLLGQALLLCGLGRRFGIGAVVAVAGLALVAGASAMPAVRRDVAGLLESLGDRRRRLWIPAIVALAGPAWLALYPPVAWDDTVYHLPLARSLVEHGRYLFVENLRAPVFPLLGETLFAPALLAGRAATAHGVSLLATLLTGLLLVAWGRDPFAGLGVNGGALAWALAPAAIWIGQPIVVFYAGSTFVDPLLTLFATAAALAFARWRAERAPAWLMASGALAGWAAATKYLGLYLVVALALAAAWEAGPRARGRALVRFAMPAALTGAPWYGLIWALSGSPIFPFLPRIFGDSEWGGLTAVSRSGLSSSWLAGAHHLLRLGWDLVADRGRVGQQPPVSPLVVAALPLLLYLAWRRPWARLWIVILGGFVGAFLLLPRDARYLMFFAPLLALLLVAALRDLLPRALAPVLVVLLGLATGPVYALWRTWQVGPPPVTPAAIDRFLSRRVPLYGALLFRRAAGLEEVPLYALHGERLHDFGGAALLGDWAGPYRYELVLPLLDRPAELAGELRRLGAAQLLLPRALIAPGLVDGIAGSPQFRVLYRDDEAVLLALSP